MSDALKNLESMGFRFSADGEDLVVKHYGIDLPTEAADLLASLDKQEAIRAIHDRAQGFLSEDGERIEVPHELLPAYLAVIK